MSELSQDERVNTKILTFFLVFGSVGAIIMSYIAYAAMVGRAL
jgi:hypothetical protein